MFKEFYRSRLQQWILNVSLWRATHNLLNSLGCLGISMGALHILYYLQLYICEGEIAHGGKEQAELSLVLGRVILQGIWNRCPTGY